MNKTPISTIIKKAFAIVIPMSTSRAFNMLTGFLGNLFIARLNHQTLAASALITSAQGMMFVMGMALLFSVGVVVGHAFGGKRHEEVGSVLQQSWLLALLTSIPIMLVLWNASTIYAWLGQKPILIPIIRTYFHAYILAIPAMMLLMATQQFLLAVNLRRFVFVMSIVGFAFTVLIAYVLINGYWGFPRLGVAGLGYAYVIQAWVSLLIYLLYCAFQKRFAAYEIFRLRIRGNLKYLKKLFSIGWPSSVQLTSDLFSYFVITILVGWIGESALAAQQIVTQYFFLLVVPVFALSQASSILIGQARGAKQFADVKRYGNTVLLIGLSFSLVITCIFVTFPHALIMLYVNHHESQNLEMIHLAKVVLILNGLRLMFDAVVEIKIGSLRGLYDTKKPMIISMACIWLINVPLAYVFGFTFHWGLIGITAASVVMVLICALVMWLRWLKLASHCHEC